MPPPYNMQTITGTRVGVYFIFRKILTVKNNIHYNIKRGGAFLELIYCILSIISLIVMICSCSSDAIYLYEYFYKKLLFLCFFYGTMYIHQQSREELLLYYRTNKESLAIIKNLCYNEYNIKTLL